MLQTGAQSGVALKVEHLTNLPELYALREEWDELIAADESATIFQSWEWVTSWYEHFGSDKQLVVLTVRDAAGRLVGIAPASLTNGPGGVRLLHVLGRGGAATEYTDAVFHPDCAEAAARAIFEAWNGNAARWDLLVFSNTPANRPLMRIACQQAKARCYRRTGNEATMVGRSLPPTWDEFYNSLGRNMRKHIKKFGNRIQKSGYEPTVMVIEDQAEVERRLDDFFELHYRRAHSDQHHRHKEKFTTDEHRAFVRTVARKLAQRGRIWLSFLCFDGTPVATQICFVLGDRLSFYHSGYDPKWAWHAVMMYLFRKCIERAIVQGIRWVDLGIGMDQEKLRWGGEPSPALNVTLASPRPRSQVSFYFYVLARSRRRAVADEPSTGEMSVEERDEGAV